MVVVVMLTVDARTVTILMDKVCSTKHKQAKHEWQELRHVSSIEFALAKQEPLSYGPLTKVEFFLLENILVYCGEQDIDVTSDNISKIYQPTTFPRFIRDYQLQYFKQIQW